MQVSRVFHPNATPSRVKRLANGADLFVYAGPRQWLAEPVPALPGGHEERLRPEPEVGDTHGVNVVYYGADRLASPSRSPRTPSSSCRHLWYASGNASSGMAIPTPLAGHRAGRQLRGRVPRLGARLSWRSAGSRGPTSSTRSSADEATMDAVFVTRYRSGVNPLNGWVGDRPGGTHR